MQGNIRVLVADDHPIVRVGVVRLLDAQPGMEVVGEAADGQEALQMVGRLRPDVVVIDLSMPGLNGVEATRQIKRMEPKTAVVMLSMHEKEAYVLQALHAGARGYVLKGAESGEILRAVAAAQRGEYYLCSRISKGVFDAFLKNHRGESPEEPYDQLSEREQQVFRMLVDGKSTIRIADLLCISPKTAEKHRANVLRKLDCPDLLCLVRYAVKIGIVDPDTWKD